ncbi:hypothetical protein AK812_SmicGene4188 [Symbiodinium microadriaticum]|uniref:lipoate--protein ligase n=1 Tax=Symbiodinium microadriaticum TaxID=2951 RepID=A0A1Q9EWZ4_SYMMI|nr:hypothetical protein AK812_SmicGene4188 [Symbiodinium microadriaticum]
MRFETRIDGVGVFDVNLKVVQGRIEEVTIFSDALFPDVISESMNVLKGSTVSPAMSRGHRKGPASPTIFAGSCLPSPVVCIAGALATFKKAISGQDFRDAVILLALIADDLRAAPASVKAFHPVKDAVNALRTEREQETHLTIIEHYVEAKDVASAATAGSSSPAARQVK